jgi:chromosome segregation ATPase
MITNLFSRIPFILCNLLAPEGTEGGGAGGEPNPNPEPPKPEGATLESKLTSATGIISNLFRQVGAIASQLATEKSEKKKVEDQFNAVAADLKKEQDTHKETQGKLSTTTTTVNGLTVERDNANKNVERLESLCQLRGIDPAQAVAPAQQSAADKTPSGKWEKYNDLKKQEATGKVAAGTAMAFWSENKTDLNKFAQSERANG